MKESREEDRHEVRVVYAVAAQPKNREIKREKE